MTTKGYKLSNERYEFIKGEVCELFIRLDVKCMPVSGFEIASKLGITLIPYSSLSVKKRREAKKISEDGFYMEDNENEFGTEYIFYNDKYIPYERQNMTILHEIGHCVLDHRGHSDEEEAEARFFAKYAIAPPVLVDKIEPSCPEDIMDYFDLSSEAAWYAYDYYLNWKRIHNAHGSYTDYERKLLRLYRRHKIIA